MRRGGGESWQHKDCEHAFCIDCMQAYVASEAKQGKRVIRCPGFCSAGNGGSSSGGGRCSNVLYTEDVAALVPSDVFEPWKARCDASYRQRLESVLGKRNREDNDNDAQPGDDGSDADLRAFVLEHCKPCPGCHVIIYRSQGCNDMNCTCGTRFCFQCGEARDSGPCACRKARALTHREARALAHREAQSHRRQVSE